jgi:hypothetical protein
MMWFTAVMPLGVGTGVGVGVTVGVGVGIGVGVGVGTGVGVGVGVGAAVTVIFSDDEKKKPVESQARITMACFPAAKESTALKDAVVLLAFCTESIYMIIAVTGWAVSRAAAEKVTGEASETPLPGAHIFTVLSTVAVHVCADAAFANSKNGTDTKIENATGRSEITEAP